MLIETASIAKLNYFRYKHFNSLTVIPTPLHRPLGIQRVKSLHIVWGGHRDTWGAHLHLFHPFDPLFTVLFAMQLHNILLNSTEPSIYTDPCLNLFDKYTTKKQNMGKQGKGKGKEKGSKNTGKHTGPYSKYFIRSVGLFVSPRYFFSLYI